jgi:hypothetical protein
VTMTNLGPPVKPSTGRQARPRRHSRRPS